MSSWPWDDPAVRAATRNQLTRDPDFWATAFDRWLASGPDRYGPLVTAERNAVAITAEIAEREAMYQMEPEA